MSDLKSRVSEYCKYRNIALSKFENRAGLSNGYFNQVKKRPSEDKIASIIKAFPDLNEEWLLTGRGNMIVGEARGNIVQNNQHGNNIAGKEVTVHKTESQLIDIIKKKDEQIDKRDEQIDRLLSIIEKMTNK